VRNRMAKVLLVVGALTALPLVAETFRCKGKIVEEGMHRDKVLELCGPPSETNHMTVNSWTYKKTHRLNTVVYFYANGHVERIETQSD
jgi:hypothetical protein